MEAADSLKAFETLVQSIKPRSASLPPPKFVKKLDEIPSVELSSTDSCRRAVQLAENALVGKFTGLWPSPKSVENWMAENWNPLLQGSISLFAAGRGYFIFLFSTKEEKDRIFRSSPFFMGSRGLFLAPWTLDFNPEAELTAAPIWVRLPHLPLHLWGKSSLEDIGNKLGRFIDSSDPKGGQFTCARICVEVNLEKGLPEAIKLTKGNWSHIQELDYEQIPFKCNSCHVYGHFAKNCPKLAESQKASPPAEAGFQTVTNRRKGTRHPQNKEAGPKTAPTAVPPRVENSFDALQEVTPEAEAEAEADASEQNKIQGPSAPSELATVEPAVKATSLRKEDKVSDGEAFTPPEDKTPEEAYGGLTEALRQLAATSKGLYSPPRTRGRKTNRERREYEADTSVLQGSQKKLDSFVKRFN